MDLDLDALEARAQTVAARCWRSSVGPSEMVPGMDPPTVLALVARAREAERSEEHRNDLADAVQQWQIRANAAEVEAARLRTVVEKLRAGLTYIRLSEWAWQGGGSKIRLPKEASQIASKALGVAPALPNGWPSEDEHEIRASAARLLAETAPDVPADQDGRAG